VAEKKILAPPMSDAGIKIFNKQVATVINKLVGNCPADSTAVDVSGVVADLNALLALIRGLSAQ
jgi:hypothetical protein